MNNNLILILYYLTVLYYFSKAPIHKKTARLLLQSGEQR